MLGRREAGEGGMFLSFVAERHPEDVDPENKSTVLRFHHGKYSDSQAFAFTVVKEKLWESDICSVLSTVQK